MEKITDEERALVRRVAAAIVDRRMAMPAILFLEGMRPMNFIGSQALHFFNPVLGTIFSFREMERLAILLEKRQSIPELIGQIEQLDEERDGREREERKRLKEQRRLERQTGGRSRWWPFGGR